MVTTLLTRETYFCSCGVKPPRLETSSEATFPNDGEPEEPLHISVSHIYLYFQFLEKYVWRNTATLTIKNNGEITQENELNPEFESEVERNNELRP